MTSNIKVVRASDFIRATPEGTADLEGAADLLRDIAASALCPLRHFDHARFFAMCAENVGCDIEAFLSYEDAMEWLIDDETTI